MRLDGKRRVAALIAAAALGCSLSAGTAAPVAAGSAGYGWVVARLPTSASYVPAARDRMNSSGKAIEVTRQSKGSYQVIFKGLGSEVSVGLPLVTPLAPALRTCSVGASLPLVGASRVDTLVNVTCFDGDGDRADSKFVLNLVAKHNGGDYAWLEANGTGNYDVPYDEFYDSALGVIHVDRIFAGSYKVTIPGQGGADGNVQVVSAGAGTCRTGSWGTSLPDQVVYVHCRDHAGLPADSWFMLTLTKDVGLRGNASGEAAYLWTDQPHNDSYLPVSYYRWSSSGVGPRVTRSARGVYVVHLKGIDAKGGSAQVTTYGDGKKHCQISGIPTHGSTQVVGVRCFGPAGAPVDSYFSFVFTR